MKNIICTLMLVLSLTMLLTACKSDKKEEGDSKPAERQNKAEQARRETKRGGLQVVIGNSSG